MSSNKKGNKNIPKTRIEWHDLVTDSWHPLDPEIDWSDLKFGDLLSMFQKRIGSLNSGLNARLFVDGKLALTFYRCGSFAGDLAEYPRPPVCAICNKLPPPALSVKFCNTCYGEKRERVTGELDARLKSEARAEKGNR